MLLIHIPILCNFTIKTEPGDKLNTGNKPIVFYKKMFDNTNWESYRSYLDANINVEGINSLEELNSYVCKIIQQADEKTIPVRKIIQGRKALPSYLVDMIKYRRKLRRNLNKSFNEANKEKYKEVNIIVKEELIAYKNIKWKEFLDKQGKNPLTSTKFWKRINYLKKQRLITTTNSI